MKLLLRRIREYFFILTATSTLLLGVNAIADPASISFTYQKRVPFVQVQPADAGQKPMRFILDTASSPTVVESMAADRLKNGASPASRWDNAAPDSVQGLRATCGGFPLNQTAVKTDLSNVSRVCGQQVDGLLGADFLKNKVLTMNTANRTLRIEPASDADGAPARFMDRIPSNRQDAVFVKVTSPATNRPLVFLVDTGTTRCCLDSKIAKSMKLSLGAQHILNMVGQKKVAYVAEKFAGNFDGHPIPPQLLAVDLSDLSWSYGQRLDGIIGMDFMERYTVKLNFRSRQMQILPNKAEDLGIAAR